MEPCISVVMPSFNRAGLLETTIPSYLQPGVGELILVDDASTDHTEDVVKKLRKTEPRIRYVKLEKNSGQPHANNVGVSISKFPYIYFADDDSFLTEGTMERLLAVMQSYPCDIAAAKGPYMHSENDLTAVEAFLKTENLQEMTDADLYFDFNTFRVNRKLYYSHPCRIDMCQACFMIRSEIAKKIHFDEKYRWNAYREETDYLLSAIQAGAVLYGVPDAYQINLPRGMTQGGGAHRHGKLLTLCQTICNNHYFLKKHYGYLKQAGKTKKSRFLLEMTFLFHETFGRVFGRLKYAGKKYGGA